ncbi:MAG: alpha-L-arabinofuranosidase C-terminal domain-containing protein [Planctomycetota bacterium]
MNYRSKDKSGKIHITLCNLNPKKSAELVCELQGARPSSITGRALTAGAMNAHNTFDNPEALRPAAFYDYKLRGDTLRVTLPSKSVVVLEIK